MAKKQLSETSCVNCGRTFTPKRAWQKFCSTDCRREAHNNSKTTDYTCTYCGQLADSRDHVPPQSVRPHLEEVGLSWQYEFVTVRCCRECNSALGARPPWTVAGRRAKAKEWIAKRYRKYLELPEWSEEDLEALGPAMRQSVQDGLAVQAVTRLRLAYTPRKTIISARYS